MSVRDYAIRAAAKLGPVFPLAPKSKDPFGKLVPNGVKNATRDPSVIREWFRPHSSLNLALALGDGLLALDVDPRNGGDETLGRIEREHFALPHTVRQNTGRRDGGAHYLFRHDPAVRLKNGPIAEGVDVKTAGGYIVIAPSIHPDTGKTYEWDLGALPSETPIAEAPAWLLDLARDRRRAVGSSTPVGPVADSFLAFVFTQAKLTGETRDDRIFVACPWADFHTDGRGNGSDSSTVLLAPTSETKLGAFHCSHSHCSRRSIVDLLDVLPADAIREGLKKYPFAAHAIRRAASRGSS